MRRWLVPALLLIAAAVGPFLGSTYNTTFLFTTLLFTCSAYGWNIISGYTGKLSFGHMAFFGLGAYTLAILTSRLHWAWPLGLLAGGLLASVLAVPIGWLMLRLRGPYFALGMLGLRELLAVVAASWEGLTRGGVGLYLKPSDNLTALYYTAAGTVALAIAFTAWLEGSRFGLRLMAIREDEDAAQAMGVDTTVEKLKAFALSAFLPGVAGGLYAWFLGYLDPVSAFPATYELQTILMALFGGAGTVWGPLLGGVSLSLLGEMFWAKFPEVHLALFGTLVVLVTLFLPRGVIPVVQEWLATRAQRRQAVAAAKEVA